MHGGRTGVADRRSVAVCTYVVEGGCDGALLDVNLRGQQVFGILPRLQALELPFNITSGYDDVTLFPALFRALPRVAKPVSEAELRRVCEDVFGLSGRGMGRFDV